MRFPIIKTRIFPEDSQDNGLLIEITQPRTTNPEDKGNHKEKRSQGHLLE